mmetsp:Transcript_180587/g.439455  ORF Transcript_180587/g.439455 Transcript_180587/m.439455 type:complete len:342 (+) Transcript_180587:1108-2133(+)
MRQRPHNIDALNESGHTRASDRATRPATSSRPDTAAASPCTRWHRASTAASASESWPLTDRARSAASTAHDTRPRNVDADITPAPARHDASSKLPSFASFSLLRRSTRSLSRCRRSRRSSVVDAASSASSASTTLYRVLSATATSSTHWRTNDACRAAPAASCSSVAATSRNGQASGVTLSANRAISRRYMPRNSASPHMRPRSSAAAASSAPCECTATTCSLPSTRSNLSSVSLPSSPRNARVTAWTDPGSARRAADHDDAGRPAAAAAVPLFRQSLTASASPPAPPIVPPLWLLATLLESSPRRRRDPRPAPPPPRLLRRGCVQSLDRWSALGRRQLEQ